MRISRSVRTTRGKTLTADYNYTFLGGVRTASYQGVNPSGYTLVYGYDDQGRQIALLDGGGIPFVNGYSFIYGTVPTLPATTAAARCRPARLHRLHRRIGFLPWMTAVPRCVPD